MLYFNVMYKEKKKRKRREEKHILYIMGKKYKGEYAYEESDETHLNSLRLSIITVT